MHTIEKKIKEMGLDIPNIPDPIANYVPYKVVNNILELETDDEWFIRGVEGLKRGSPTSAFLIWEQCSRSGSLSLEEVFQFELDLAIQVTRHQDFTEGIRAIIIDKDNNPQWIYTKVEDVTKEWIEEHLHPAWN